RGRGRSAPPYRLRTAGSGPRPAGRLAASTGARPRRPLESLARRPLYGCTVRDGSRPTGTAGRAPGSGRGPVSGGGAQSLRRQAGGQGRTVGGEGLLQRANPASFARSWSTDLVWIWLTLLSVTPRTLPISARVRPS